MSMAVLKVNSRQAVNKSA